MSFIVLNLVCLIAKAHSSTDGHVPHDFDFLLDTSSWEDFSTVRLEGAFHLGSLGCRGGETARPETSEGIPSLEAHLDHLRGCEDARIGIHSTGSSEHFSTEEVAQKLTDLGFQHVLDLGDIPQVREGHGFDITSGEVEKHKPLCAKRSPRNGEHDSHDSDDRPHRDANHMHDSRHGSSHGRDHHNSDHESHHTHDTDDSFDHHGHRENGKDRSEENEESSVAKLFKAGATWEAPLIALGLILAALMCYNCRRSSPQVGEPPFPVIGESVVSVQNSFPSFDNDENLGTVETINGSPEGFGETTTLPQSFEDVEQTEEEGTYTLVVE